MDRILNQNDNNSSSNSRNNEKFDDQLRIVQSLRSEICRRHLNHTYGKEDIELMESTIKVLENSLPNNYVRSDYPPFKSPY